MKKKKCVKPHEGGKSRDAGKVDNSKPNSKEDEMKQEELTPHNSKKKKK